MIYRGVLKAAAAAAAVASAVAASLVAASFALYALLEPQLGRPGAAAIVALVFALVAVILALILTHRRSRHRLAETDDQGLAERLLDTARSKPLLTAAAAAAAGFIAWRNPALIGVIANALFGRRDDRPR